MKIRNVKKQKNHILIIAILAKIIIAKITL